MSKSGAAMTKLKVLDLFAGIAGMSLGLHRTGGFETVRFCEIKPHARAVIEKNFGPVPIDEDVTTMEFTEGEAMLSLPAFPCQDVSFAGNGAGLAGSRSGLYREVVRALRVVRPLRALCWRTWQRCLVEGWEQFSGTWPRSGMTRNGIAFQRPAVGAPHRRDRIWIIAHPRGKQYEGGSAPLSGSLAAQLLAEDTHAAGERCDEGALDETNKRNGLPALAKKWPTPTTRDWKSSALGDAGQQPAALGSRRQWAAEPDVGRMAHGISQKLDGAFDAEEYHAEAGAAVEPHHDSMPGVRRDGATAEASLGLLEAGSSRNPLHPMPCEGGPAGRTSAREADESVQGVRHDVFFPVTAMKSSTCSAACLATVGRMNAMKRWDLGQRTRRPESSARRQENVSTDLPNWATRSSRKSRK
jgi:DNA (cytosine-5)-methyltransferase 1